MSETKFIVVNGKLVPNPDYAEKESVWKKDMREDMTDLTGMTEEDRAWTFGTKGVDGREDMEDDDMRDMFEVKTEDIMGERPITSEDKRRMILRRIKPLKMGDFTPPTNASGMNSGE